MAGHCCTVFVWSHPLRKTKFRMNLSQKGTSLSKRSMPQYFLWYLIAFVLSESPQTCPVHSLPVYHF